MAKSKSANGETGRAMTVRAAVAGSAAAETQQTRTGCSAKDRLSAKMASTRYSVQLLATAGVGSESGVVVDSMARRMWQCVNGKEENGCVAGGVYEGMLRAYLFHVGLQPSNVSWPA
jgi:hypothetical protein